MTMDAVPIPNAVDESYIEIRIDCSGYRFAHGWKIRSGNLPSTQNDSCSRFIRAESFKTLQFGFAS